MATPGDLPQSVIDPANPEGIPPPPDNPADNDPKPSASANQVVAASRPDPITEYLKKHPSERLTPPPLRPLPETHTLPMPPKQEWQNPMMSLAGPLIFLTLFGGLMSKKSGMNAMTAATGLIKGHMEGQQANFDANYNNWKSNVQTTLANNKIATDHYKSVLEDDKLTVAHKLSALYGAATAYQHPVMQALLNNGDFEGFRKAVNDFEQQQARAEAGFTLTDEWIMKRDQAKANVDLAKASTERANAQAKSSNTLANQRIGAQWDENTIALKVEQGLKGDIQGALQGSGGGLIGNQNKALLMNALSAEATKRGMTGPQLSNLQQQFRAVGNALSASARTGATREANLGIILETVKTAIPGAIAASEKLPRGRFVPVNELVQMAESKISDSNLKVFRQKNLQLAELWAKSMNPTGVMRNEDRNLALGILSTADSKETYKDVVNSLAETVGMEEEGAIRFLENRGLGSIIKQHPKALVEGGATGSETGGGGPVRVSTPEEAEKLAPGTHYVTPEGKGFTR